MMPQSKALSYFILLLVAVVFVSVFSVSTSFLYPYPDTLDSHVFQIIGKYWARGSIPYIDLWDQKGPVIYFINAVGYWLTDNKIGVFIIQILFLYIDLIVLKIIFQRKFSYKRTILFLLLFLFALAQLYSGGNGVEEYILPFLLLGFYSQYKCIKSFAEDNVVIHPPILALLYGFSLAFALLSRLTNALGICAGAAFIGILLIAKNEWKCLFYNFLAFIFGFVLLFLPFAIYFSAHNAFDDMWYATITYNMEYAANASNIVTLNSFLFNLLNPLCAYFCVIASIYLLFHKHVAIGLFGITIVLFPLMWILSSNGYTHYSILCLPYLAIAILQLKDFYDKNILSSKIKRLLQASFSLVIICCIFANVRSISRGYFYRSYKSEYIFFKSLLSHIQEGKLDSFVSFNISPSIYIYNDIKPASRFFCNQFFYCYNSKSMSKIMNEDLSKINPKWLLVRKGNEMLKKKIDNCYSLCNVDSYKGEYYELYKHK